MQFLDRSGKDVSVKQTVAPPATYSVSLYSEPPSHDITIEEFERLALDRLAGALSWRPASQVT
jgi:hypothetical protein